ncbi:50S ribosome-binding GTPase [Candidatus Woesearchaeota archaeon]|nr:50S ribosome-binding GTPase [Candidatus Woesearchaeota archaeon]
MGNFWRLVNRVIDESEILLLILDARMIEESRNSEVETKIKKLGKKLLYVVNKADLVDRATLEKKIPQPGVLVSSKERWGSTILLKKLLQLANKQETFVGVLGYPNVGKSSVVNMLKGQGSASVSSHAGHTKGIQKIKIHRLLMLLDTPGVLPRGENDLEKQVKIGSKNAHQITDPVGAAYGMLETEGERICAFYGIAYIKDPMDALETLAKKRKLLLKRGGVDEDRMARLLITDWQLGKMHDQQKHTSG